MTWNQELTQPEYQTSHSRIDKCLWKPIRKLLLIHLAFPFTGRFLLLIPACPSDLNATPQKCVCGGAEGGFWGDFHSLCVQKQPLVHQSRVTERAFMNFPSESTLLSPNRSCPIFQTSNDHGIHAIQYNCICFSSFLSTSLIW